MGNCCLLLLWCFKQTDVVPKFMVCVCIFQDSLCIHGCQTEVSNKQMCYQNLWSVSVYFRILSVFMVVKQMCYQSLWSVSVYFRILSVFMAVKQMCYQSLWSVSVYFRILSVFMAVKQMCYQSLWSVCIFQDSLCIHGCQAEVSNKQMCYQSSCCINCMKKPT